MLAEREPETWPVLPLAAPCAQVSSSSDPQHASKYYRARYYDPKVGRFISEDPLSVEVRPTGELNAYAYVANNPVNMLDPWGLQACPPKKKGSDCSGEYVECITRRKIVAGAARAACAALCIKFAGPAQIQCQAACTATISGNLALALNTCDVQYKQCSKNARD